MRASTKTALVGLVGSLLVSAILWWYLGWFVFFIAVPFVPFLFRGSSSSVSEPEVWECPQCGFRTTNGAFDYCPRDGNRLQ